MTLPGSGPISIGAASGTNDITVEFGIARATPFPTGFYGLGGAPSSGPLGFHDFYGRSRSSISASKSQITANGFNAADSSTITCVGGTIASWVLTQGVESSRVTKPTIGASTSFLSVTNPAAGNGSIINTYGITDSNGNYVEVGVNAQWGIA